MHRELLLVFIFHLLMCSARWKNLFRGPVILKKSEPSPWGEGINTHTLSFLKLTFMSIVVLLVFQLLIDLYTAHHQMNLQINNIYLNIFENKIVWKIFKHVFLGQHLLKTLTQGITGSAPKPTLIQDTGYMIEKTYHDLAPYLVAFGAYLMPQ